MPNTILDGRSVISFSGPDATNLLHNVLTCNIETLEKGTAQIGALLTPQGKIMFELIVSKVADDAYLVELGGEQAGAFIQRMTMYRLRSKVEIAESSESLVEISWGADSTTSSDTLRDVRFKSTDVYRRYLAAGTPDNGDEWDMLRIEYGVPEAGSDYALADAFPHDVSFDQNGGVDFTKGCYIGQEVVSRMHHRHTARRRMLIANGPMAGDTNTIVANEKPLGTLGTKVGQKAIALCRIDRVQDAMDSNLPITAGGNAITLTLPPDVSYDWQSAEPSDA